MPRNVEIKALVKNLSVLKAKAVELSGTEGELLHQEDVFFNSPQGRLKLRVIKGEKEELIYYERPDQEGPKFSDYIKVSGSPGELTGDLKTLLSRCLGVKGSVTKTRTLHLVQHTRVHIDSVQGLGDFMELEVMLQDDQTVEDGEKVAKDLMEKLGIKEEDLLKGAYMDMILNK
ncbi:hypothetical protein Pmani_021736 [Petrolisthes manimaculis]|uniref:CYTH domain-containing protein n=1 Tax=Petrolisthes manimaculis TaxID=1843537 RepID=A0AAE1U504_9EUCA|nr:hypothetical protein Pmani_021736 [Petrolisthes manimaculis]